MSRPEAANFDERRSETAKSFDRSWIKVLGRSVELVRRNQSALVGLILVSGLVGVAAFAPYLAPHDPHFIQSVKRLTPPLTDGFILGADELGRDILSRLIWGARLALIVSVVPVIVSLGIGLFIGMLSGYIGGKFDNVTMRVLDVFFAFPKVLLALGLAAVIGPSLRTVLITITLVSIPIFARLTRSLVVVTRTELYVEAAEAMGSRLPRILGRHVLPNIVPTVAVYATLETGRNLILTASLSFLGVGVQPPEADWGLMLSEGRSLLALAPHVATIPGLAIFLGTLGFNLLGDALRDSLDPRMQKHL